MLAVVVKKQNKIQHRCTNTNTNIKTKTSTRKLSEWKLGESMMVGCRRPQAPRPPDLDEDNTPPPPLCHLAINPLPGNTALRIFFLMIAKK